MPYKDPKRKRQWEQEHREQRNAQRRKIRVLQGLEYSTVAKLTPDPASTQQSGDGWKELVSLVFGIGLVLLSAIAGIRVPGSNH